MKTISIILLVCSLILFTTSCTVNTKKVFDSIEGSWISTDETSWKFESGIQKIFIKIQKEQNDSLIATGIIVWNDEFESYWNLSKIQYDTLMHNFSLLDTMGHSFKGFFDPIENKIEGIYKHSDGEIDSLIFIPSGAEIETAMLYPRLTDQYGNITCQYQQPEQLNDMLVTASIQDIGIDSSMINQLISDIIDQEYGRIESFLMVKDNKLVLEEYFYGYNRTKKHHIYSCTKSITSLLLGIALEQHKKYDIFDQSVFNFFPHLDSLRTPEKEKITAKHLLTMSTGLEWDEYPGEMYKPTDRTGYVLSRQVEYPAGEEFHYNSGNSIVLGGIILSLIKEDVESFCQKFLFNPMGITDYTWKTHTSGELEYWNGLQMTPRDMAKIGLLVQNKGEWNQKQIVSKNWILESTKPYIAESEFFDYGYQWWIRSENCKRWWDNQSAGLQDDVEMIIALSWGGQYIIVINEYNLVIVTTASNYSNDKAMAVFPMIIERVIPAIKGNQTS